MKFSFTRNRAFTLIELLIVITIIGILAVALVPKLTGGTARARDAQRKADLQQIATALEFYADDNSGYPATPGGSCLRELSGDLGSYLTTFPADPKDGSTDAGVAGLCGTGYSYFAVSNGYILAAQIETETDTGSGMYESGFVLAAGSTAAQNFADTDMTACDAAEVCTNVVYAIGR